ncbi:zinc finger protein 862-like [Anoplolepis gracilipes]|uniref:zinc finger protein 862-like n=1 Tax=Anoplolepis gracilipes TaxID=354296 RepID=UPI003BA14319
MCRINIAHSLAVKHQLGMCHRFMSKEDIILDTQIGSGRIPNLNEMLSFFENLPTDLKGTECVSSNWVEYKGTTYKIGMVVATVCKFSILIDESTDLSDSKLMYILVRYVSPLNKRVKTQLLQLVALNATDCTAEKFFETFKNILEEKEIPITNIVEMASDNASVMIGCNNSFMQRLKLKIPGLITLNCICHSTALIANKACETLPSSCENLIREVCTYISGSAKRCAILVEFQDFFNVQRKKLLKLSNTRWLVLQKCVVRLLDNWEAENANIFENAPAREQCYA